MSLTLKPGLDKLLDWWQSSAQGKALIQEQQDLEDAARTNARQEIERVEKEHAERLPALVKAREAARVKRQAALQKFRDAEAALRDANVELVGAAASVEAQVYAQKSVLHGLADMEAIHDFRRELEQLYKETGNQLVSRYTMEPGPTGDLERWGESNYAAVLRRGTYLLKAIQTVVSEWPYRGLAAGPALEEAKKEILDGIPDASEFSKPTRQPNAGPLTAAPSFN